MGETSWGPRPSLRAVQGHLRLRCASRQTVQKWQRHAVFHTLVRLVSPGCISKVLIANLRIAAGFGSEEESAGAVGRWLGSPGQKKDNLATPEEAALTTQWQAVEHKARCTAFGCSINGTNAALEKLPVIHVWQSIQYKQSSWISISLCWPTCLQALQCAVEGLLPVLRIVLA